MLMKVTQHLRYLATCPLMSMTMGRTCHVHRKQSFSMEALANQVVGLSEAVMSVPQVVERASTCQHLISLNVCILDLKWSTCDIVVLWFYNIYYIDLCNIHGSSPVSFQHLFFKERQLLFWGNEQEKWALHRSAAFEFHEGWSCERSLGWNMVSQKIPNITS